MGEISGDPQPSPEARRGLLEDVRSIRDLCAQERARTENQLYAAQQAVTALSTQLRMADEKLNIVEELVGEVQVRMLRRGLATHPITRRPSSKPSPKPCLGVDLSNGTPPRKFHCKPSRFMTHN